MDALAAEGFVLLGGPLERKDVALLIIRAADEAELRARLAADPWSRAQLLEIASVYPWTLRLGKRFFESQAGAARPKANKSKGGAAQKAKKSQARSVRKANRSQPKPKKAKRN